MTSYKLDIYNEIAKRQCKIIAQINNIDLHILEIKDEILNNPINYNKKPLVFIISGVATGGKDLFIKYVTDYVNDYLIKFSYNVYNTSSIDEVKRIVDYMNTVDNSLVAKEAIDNKTDKYRTLLHDIKMAWSAFDDGPNQVIYNLINKIMTRHCELMYNPSFIFVHVREANEIDNMKQYLIYNMELIPISIGVIGHSNPKDFTNEGDALANEYDYDIIIPNNGNVKEFRETSCVFARNAMCARAYYGI